MKEIGFNRPSFIESGPKAMQKTNKKSHNNYPVEAFFFPEDTMPMQPKQIIKGSNQPRKSSAKPGA